MPTIWKVVGLVLALPIFICLVVGAVVVTHHFSWSGCADVSKPCSIESHYWNLRGQEETNPTTRQGIREQEQDVALALAKAQVAKERAAMEQERRVEAEQRLAAERVRVQQPAAAPAPSVSAGGCGQYTNENKRKVCENLSQ